MAFTRSAVLAFTAIFVIFSAASDAAMANTDEDDIDQIVGGVTVGKGDQPYMVHLRFYKTGVVGFSYCGGTIINKKTIMTAAHCFRGQPYAKIEAYLRAWTVSPMDPSAIQLTILSDYIRIHPGYETFTNKNDIALIRLPTALNFFDYWYDSAVGSYYWIDQVYRPSSDFTFEGYTSLALGWGRTNSTVAKMSPTMQGVALKVLSKEECTNRWALYGYSHDSQLCAYNPYKSACNGDSGGALVTSGVQIGITSFGAADAPCDVTGAIFTRVSYYRTWIEANMAY